MSLLSRSNQYGKVFSGWSIRSNIGNGSKGTIVYKIVRKDLKFEEVSALKAIPIISEHGDFNSLSDRSKEEYQKALLERKAYAMNEVQNMSKVRGHTNIVDYFDYNIAEWEDENEFGCDFLIRMELLYDLRTELKRGRIFSETEVIQIGKDICSALVVCHRKDILHRDIKPENIFFNDDGDYKLGDFGIARILDNCSSASSNVGTHEYAAPEQFNGRYDMEVDIYSLGLVLYELTNQNRLPFAESAYVNVAVVRKRINAKILPHPCDASPDLARIILKACAYEPSDRYQSAQEMLDALNQIGNANPAKHRPFVPHDPPRHTDPDPRGGSRTTEQALSDSVASPDFGRTDTSQNSVEQQPALIDEVRDFLNKANTGDVKAMKNLGDCYYNGQGVAKDYSVAVEWYQKAANKGYAEAMNSLGNCYYYGQGVAKDQSIAAEWYLKAAASGSVAAMYNLGNHYYYGDSIFYSAAVKWYQMAADNGSVEAMNRLGDCYYYGRGVAKDHSIAVEWYQKAADKGSVEAMNGLGNCYYYGQGVGVYYSLAVKWYRKAADKGYAEAMYNLGNYYYYGKVEKDYSAAVEWYQKAADNGSKKAMDMLGHCYSHGLGVKKDISLAEKWRIKADPRRAVKFRVSDFR